MSHDKATEGITVGHGRNIRGSAVAGAVARKAMIRKLAITVLFAGLVAMLMTFQPAGAQGDVTYIDYLATQIALNTQATLAAGQQQQSASVAQSQAAAAQAQAQAALAAAAQAQANAAYAAQQATAQAGQQQAAIVAAQSTADAYALRATAISQETKTAIEATVTAQAVQAEQTRQAVQARLQASATGAAIEATRTVAAIQAEAQRQNDAAVATAVAGSLRATQTAIDAQATVEAQQRETDRNMQTGLLSIGLVVTLIVGGVLIWLAVSVARAGKRRVDEEPTFIIIDVEMERRMEVFRELYRMQRKMLDPRRALTSGDEQDT